MYKLSLKNNFRSTQITLKRPATAPVDQTSKPHERQISWEGAKNNTYHHQNRNPDENNSINCQSEDVYSNLSEAETVHNQVDIFNDDDRSDSDATIYNQERDSHAGVAYGSNSSCL